MHKIVVFTWWVNEQISRMTETANGMSSRPNIKGLKVSDLFPKLGYLENRRIMGSLFEEVDMVGYWTYFASNEDTMMPITIHTRLRFIEVWKDILKEGPLVMTQKDELTIRKQDLDYVIERLSDSRNKSIFDLAPHFVFGKGTTDAEYHEKLDVIREHIPQRITAERAKLSTASNFRKECISDNIEKLEAILKI